MKFPNNEWPISKGKMSSSWSQHSKNVTARRLDPITTATDNTLSSSDNSFHNNNNTQLLHPDHLEVEEGSTSNSGLHADNTKRRVIKHEQLNRRPLHTYTATGATGVSVNGTGIKSTSSYPPSQH